MAKGPLAMLPPGAMSILKEVGRHILRRPVVGVAVVARAADTRILLIRRADTGGWALPGGTLEWNETLRKTVVRELAEEAGATVTHIGRVTGVYSRPDRDPRFHAVTVIAACVVGDVITGPKNPLEIREARFFAEAELPSKLSMDMHDMLEHALRGGDAELE